MITREEISTYSREDLPVISEKLSQDDIHFLVGLLEEKDDSIRYPAFLLLRSRSEKQADVYPYWDVLTAKFQSPNSFIRSIGIMLVADNVRWDDRNQFGSIIEDYLDFVDDEKPITVRQCIQSLGQIVEARPEFAPRICDRLLAVDISLRKETQQKLLLMDILSVFVIARKHFTDERIEKYILNALTGELLDKKAKTEFQKKLEE